MLREFLVAGFLVGFATALNSSTSVFPSGSEAQLQYLQSSVSPCDALITAGLKNRLLLPTDSNYEPQIQTWWALNSRLRPWCLVLPQNSEEVSLVLTTLLNAGHGAGDWHIALRSGGHSWPGSNNIVNGITIDLSMMNSSHYDKTTNTARLEPGGRWGQVYTDLQEQGVTVAGGRDGGVGVGGFVLGGGISFFYGKRGFSCDSVINFEVVLADGSIVNANKTTNSDLWRALKGGGSNFGIVTRYDFEAIPTRNLSYDLLYLDARYFDMVTDVVVDFANYDESFGDNALVPFLTYGTSFSNGTVVALIHVNTAGNSSLHTSFDNLKNLTAIYSNSTMKTMAEAATGSEVAAGTLSAGLTQTLKNDPKILRYCAQIHEEFVESLKQSIGADQFTTFLFLQPLPSYLGQIGKERGGNMLGLENVGENGVLWTASVIVKSDAASLAIAQAGLYAMSEKLKKFCQSINGSIDLVYLNYADPSQNPLGSYGSDNVQHIHDVATKYDPSGAFQSRFPGGFKISRVL